MMVIGDGLQLAGVSVLYGSWVAVGGGINITGSVLVLGYVILCLGQRGVRGSRRGREER